MNSEEKREKISDNGSCKPANIIADLTYIAKTYDFGPKTTIYNEDWLLRILLYFLKNDDNLKDLTAPYLPFAERAKIYSKAQLYTPFAQRTNEDKTGEDNVNVDGVAGEWTNISGTKLLIQLDKNFSYITVFESKILSGLSPVRHKGTWNQISRTIAGIIYSAITSKTALDNLPDLNFVFLYSSENKKIKIDKYTMDTIKSDILKRVALYNTGGPPMNHDFPDFETNWEKIFAKNIKITFQKWEDIVNAIGNEEFKKFYGKCMEYNRKP